MGLAYLTSEEIKRNRAYISSHLTTKASVMVRKELEKGFFSAHILQRYGKDAAILELGCGGGLVLKAFSDKGFSRLSGVDIDDYLGFPELRGMLHIADLNKDTLPFPDGSFDVVCALEILEHLENPFFIEREVARVLRPGGLFILSTPNGHTIWDKVRFFTSGNLKNYHLKNNHITFLTRDVFAKTFLKDFALEETIYDQNWSPWVWPRRITRRLYAHLPTSSLWSLKKCQFLIRK